MGVMYSFWDELMTARMFVGRPPRFQVEPLLFSVDHLHCVYEEEHD